jgi:uncharacterized membrane protein
MKRKRGSTINTLLTIIGIALVVAAVWDQLQRPPAERTWYGSVFGIPYDFRVPTVERLREAFWNKDDTRIFVPCILGVGWSINFYPLLHAQPIPQER